jgi:acetyl-CoA synthetase
MIYLPLIPEAVVAMLGCARVGAVHSVVFGGFAAEALRDRMLDAGAKVVITADGGWRRGKVVRLREQVDAAVASVPAVEHVVVVRRLGDPSLTSALTEAGPEGPPRGAQQHWWHELMDSASRQHPAPAHDSEHPLFILYTSGTTGKPKGIVHTTAGYLLGAHVTTGWVFGLRPDDVYFCTADIGWITGHSYVVYGPLSQGATVVVYEGAPDYPAPDRWWQLIERERVSVLYTAPTALRAFIRAGDRWPLAYDLSSLRLLGTVGEPINPEAWRWYHRVIGGGRCPIVDTWWQTETGSILMAPLPPSALGSEPNAASGLQLDATEPRGEAGGPSTAAPLEATAGVPPGSCGRPLPGIVADVVHRDGRPCAPGELGYLVVQRPWPSMLRTIHGDDERYVRQYWRDVPGSYFTGDGARRDEQGNFWVVGRVDDVLNVAGHRLGTAEVESALVAHAAVAEAAVVGRPDDLKGQAVVAFVTLKQGTSPDAALREALRTHVATTIGAIARPDELRFADALPKTRSGKILRRLLKEIAIGGAAVGDTTTLEDPTALLKLGAPSEPTDDAE